MASGSICQEVPTLHYNFRNTSCLQLSPSFFFCPISLLKIHNVIISCLFYICNAVISNRESLSFETYVFRFATPLLTTRTFFRQRTYTDVIIVRRSRRTCVLLSFRPQVIHPQNCVFCYYRTSYKTSWMMRRKHTGSGRFVKQSCRSYIVHCMCLLA